MQDGPAPRGGRDDGARGFGGIGDARSYTPRGRTVREAGERGRVPRTGSRTDPFRPALQVLDGGRPAGRGRPAGGPATADDAARTTAGDPATTRRTRAADRRDAAGRDAAGRDAAGRDAAGRDAAGGDAAGRRTPAAPGRPRDGRTRDARERAARDRAGRARDEEARGARTRDADPRDGRAAAPRRAAADDRARTGAPGRTRQAAPRRPGARPTAVPAGRLRLRLFRRRPPGRGAAGRAPAGTPPRLAGSTRRLRLGTVLALALFATIGVRLVVLQVAEDPKAVQAALTMRQNRLSEVVLPAARGRILDRSGAVLAQSVEARYVYADPELVRDPAAVAARLSPLLGVAPSRLAELMARKKRPGGGASRFEYLARGVDVPVAEQITAMKLPGIGVDRDERRDVPGADLAANLIGFTGEDHAGLEGLEARYDELLRGTDGLRVFETGNPDVDQGALAKEIPGGYHRETPAQPGTSLQLTIDRDLQFQVQRILGDSMKRVNAVIGAAVVLDVRTGEVLAQASYPSYNAAKPFDAKPAERDDVASSVIIDPGSTHKAFVLGAALQERLITPDSAITVGPALRRGGFTFADTHPHPRGTKLTMSGVLAYSSNVGTILIADKLGPQRVYEYQQRFGLGRATGQGMPGEATGRLLAPDEWSPSASGSVPVGMSVDATLIQMAAGYAAIANDGTYVQPHLVRATVAPDGRVGAMPAPQTRPVLSPTVARQLRTMMEAVVDADGGTGGAARVQGYRVAGKTGTGKRLIDGRYTRYNAGSFVGMAPAEDPRYVVAVFADVPNGTGGEVAAPAFSKMMAFTLARNHVPPSGTKPPAFALHP